MATATIRSEPATDTPSRGHDLHAVSRPHDPAEQQADHAADTVATGGSVAGWSFLQVAAATLHRQDHGAGGGPPPQPDLDPSDEAEEARDAVLEALPQTEAGQRVIQAVRDDPGVRRIEEALTSTPALVGYGIGAAVAVGVGIGATVARARSGAQRTPEDDVELPMQMPDVPLDVLLPGLSGRIAWEGPVDAPTNAGIVLTFREQGPSSDPEAERRREAARTARMADDLRRFREGLRSPEERRREQAAIARMIAQRTLDPTSPTLLIPFGGAPPRVVPPARLQLQPPSMLRPPERRGPSLLGDQQLHLGPMPTVPPPVPRAAVDQGDPTSHLTADVASAVAGGGRPLEPGVRRAMEARFGWDFSRVRLHDDTAAAGAARGLRARAFTVGDQIALDPAAADLATAAGQRTLAHELAHVVQTGHADPLSPAHAPTAAPRVHDDRTAHAAALRLGAHAFTWRGEIHLGPTIGTPGAPSRSEAIAHEQRHVHQMRNPGPPAPLSDLEREAHDVGGPSPRLAADPEAVLGWWFVVPVAVGAYILLRPNVANAPGPSDATHESVGLGQITAEALALFAVPAGVAGALGRLGYGVVASYALGGAASTMTYRGVQDVAAGEFSGVQAYIVDATTGAVIGVVAGGTVRLLGGPGAASTGPTRRLVHLTDEAGHTGITSEGLLRGSQGIYALPDDAVLQSTAVRVLRTGLMPRQTTHVVPVTPAAARAFTQPLPIGPVSAYQRLAGVHRAPAGVLDLSTGALTPSTSPLANISGQFWPYGIDAMVWVSAGAAGWHVSPATTSAPERGLFSQLGPGRSETRSDGPFVLIEPGSPEASQLLLQAAPAAGDTAAAPAVILVAPQPYADLNRQGGRQ